MRRSYLLLGLVVLVGCLDDQRRGGIRNEPFRSNAAPQPKLPPGSVEAATRVDSIGRDIMNANPDLTIKPYFLTVGEPHPPTIFHRGTSEIYVSETLVKQCDTDGKLAAVLCSELGKMVAEQDQIERNRPRNDLPVRSGLPGGLSGSGDQTELAELGFHEKSNPRRLNSPEPMMDSRVIARDLLIRAKFSGEELNRVEPLLTEASKHHQLEHQMTRSRANP